MGNGIISKKCSGVSFRTKRYLLAGLWVAPLLIPVSAEACAFCWIQDAPFAKGFQGTLLFLMVAPFAVVGSIAGWLLWAHRRASVRHRREISAQGGPTRSVEMDGSCFDEGSGRTHRIPPHSRELG